MKRLVLLAALLLSCGKPAELPKPTLSFTPCHERFECASFDVPIDAARPYAGNVSLSLVRWKATGPRIGTVFINPGGPGVGIVDLMPQLFPLVEFAAPNVARRFDVVGIDWRGAGNSTPVHCLDEAGLDALRTLEPDSADPAVQKKVQDAVDALQKSCGGKNNAALLGHVDTVSAAKDMELVREALGEDKISFLGLSYGTWLGAVYASMFPEHVRAFVLDGAIAPPADHRDGMRSLAKAQEDGLGRFFEQCAADSKCLFHKDDVKREAEAFDAIVKAVRTAPLAVGTRKLGTFDLANALMNDLYAEQGGFDDLAKGLAAAEKGDGSVFLAQSDAAFGRDASGHYGQNLIEAYLAIGCSDSPFPEGFGAGDFDVFLKEVDSLAPHMGRLSALAERPCVGWPWRSAIPKIDAGKAPPLLVINATHDSATPLSDAELLVKALGNGTHLLPAEADGHVAILHNSCALSAMESYLLNPAGAPPESCPP